MTPIYPIFYPLKGTIGVRSPHPSAEVGVREAKKNMEATVGLGK